MKNIVFIFFYLFFLCSLQGLAKSKNVTTINVKLVDKNLVVNEVPLIKIDVSPYPFGGVEFYRSHSSSYEQEAMKGGNVFVISAPSDIFYMYIYYTGQKSKGGVYYWIDNIYAIKAGSDLTIELDNQNVKFFGQGSILPNIQSQIIGHSYKKSKSARKLLDSSEYGLYFKEMDKGLDSVLELQLSLIERNKGGLGDEDVKQLIANCYGYRYYTQLRGYDFELVQNEAFVKALKKYYSDKLNIPKSPSFTDEILNKSPIFANYLLEKMNILERIQHEKYLQKLSEISIRNILKQINRDYYGIARDKLLTLLVLRTEENENVVPFINEILYKIKNKRYNDFLVSRIKSKQKMSPFKDFELQDENGKLYTLNDFKNKVVVMDFWFTGCENCAILNEAMKPIVKQFSKNDRIAFVSVSIDKNKVKWIKSIQKGQYTHSETVNLFTNGEGNNHDLIKYYNITGYPSVFIIKDGLMFSSLPPVPSPSIQIGQELSPEGIRFVELLEQALK